MNYTITDLIQKLIDIKNVVLQIYEQIEYMPQNKFQTIGIIARAIKKEEKKHIVFYENLKIELKDDLDETIDFYLYDKVAKLLYEFKSHIKLPQINNVQDLIKYTVEFNKNIIGLLLDIQGRLLGKMADVNNNVYKVISRIIKEEEKHEKAFEQLILPKK